MENIFGCVAAWNLTFTTCEYFFPRNKKFFSPNCSLLYDKKKKNRYAWNNFRVFPVNGSLAATYAYWEIDEYTKIVYTEGTVFMKPAV